MDLYGVLDFENLAALTLTYQVLLLFSYHLRARLVVAPSRDLLLICIVHCFLMLATTSHPLLPPTVHLTGLFNPAFSATPTVSFAF